jgi:hypothetical protein
MKAKKKIKLAHEVRKVIFSRCYGSEKLSETPESLLQSDYKDNLTRVKYPEYHEACTELYKQLEDEQILFEEREKEQNRKMEEQVVSQQLQRFLTPEEAITLSQTLSDNVLRQFSQSSTKKLDQNAIEELKVKWITPGAKSWSHFLASIQSIFPDDSGEVVIQDSIKEAGGYLFFPDDKYKEIFPTRIIKEREEYKVLNNWILKRCTNTNAVVVGDPGIGKSTMLKVLFVRLKKKGKAVFWVMESGRWVYYIDGQLTTGLDSHEKKALWLPDDVWLLIDGKATDVYLSKMSKAVVFSSPQKHNYNTFLKTTCAMKLVLPPWSEDEVEALFSQEYNTKYFQSPPGYELMMPFWDYLRAAHHTLADSDKTELFSKPSDSDQTTTSEQDDTDTKALPNYSERFSHSDLDLMHTTLLQISQDTNNLLTTEEILKYVTFPMKRKQFDKLFELLSKKNIVQSTLEQILKEITETSLKEDINNMIKDSYKGFDNVKTSMGRYIVYLGLQFRKKGIIFFVSDA